MIKNLIKNRKLAKVITDISIRSLYINCQNHGSSISRNYNAALNIKREAIKQL